jgi:hypothetical protein
MNPFEAFRRMTFTDMIAVQPRRKGDEMKKIAWGCCYYAYASEGAGAECLQGTV